MARGRKKRAGWGRWLFRLMALTALVAAGFAGWLWWDMRSWKPAETLYPEQGAVIASGASEATSYPRDSISRALSASVSQ